MRSLLKVGLVVATVTLALGGVIASSLLGDSAQKTGCANTVESGAMIVEWTERFDSVASMKAAAQAIILGDVVSSQAGLLAGALTASSIPTTPFL